MSELHPHPEQHRRAEDNTRSARVAFSPFAAIGHMATTGLLAVAVIGFGGSFYSTVQQNDRDSSKAIDSVKSLEGTVGNMEKRLRDVESEADKNRQAIDRVEEQAKQDRGEIIRRLEAIDSNVDELNRFLRSQGESRTKDASVWPHIADGDRYSGQS